MAVAPNANQIYVVKGQDGWTDAMTTANTTRTGAAGTTYPFNTAAATPWAGDTDGSFVFYFTFVPLGTNVASVARVFENNGSSAGTAANNTLVLEVTLPATTASEVAALTPINVTMNKLVRPGYNYFVTIGTAVAAGWKAYLSGGSYTA